MKEKSKATGSRDRECHGRRKGWEEQVKNERKMMQQKKQRAKCIQKRQRKNIKGEETEGEDKVEKRGRGRKSSGKCAKRLIDV